MVAGNSLGGYASLATAVKYPETVKGVVLLNAAGRFEEVKAEAQAQVEAALPDNPIGQEAKGALREVITSQPSASSCLWMSVALETGASDSPYSTGAPGEHASNPGCTRTLLRLHWVQCVRGRSH